MEAESERFSRKLKRGGKQVKDTFFCLCSFFHNKLWKATPLGFKIKNKDLKTGIIWPLQND